jgi:tetratricopeptide (TPR) repeat protein
VQQGSGSARVARVGEIEPIAVAGILYQPLRRALGVRAFGINAYIARAQGDRLIEPHDEMGTGSGGHEEAYIVLSGRATFSVDGEEIDAPAGTIVFVPDVRARRSAVAAEADTVAVVVGGPADRALPVSAFEYWFAAEGPFRDGDYRRAIEIAAAGFEHWPDHPMIHYQLACYHALAGDRDEALTHLARATEGDPRAKEWARADRDLDPIRDDARFAAAIAVRAPRRTASVTALQSALDAALGEVPAAAIFRA